MTPTIGYAIREQNRYVLDDPAIDAVEITFERADDPLRLNRYVGKRHFDYVSVHALKLSPGSPDPPGRDYMDALRAIALENGARSVSDHLGFTRDGHDGMEMGHFAPVPCTAAALDVVARNVEAIQRHFDGLHFFLENIAYVFEFKGEWPEAEFLRRVLERTGCGWLLDITNVYANSRNFNFDPFEFVRHVLPAAQRVQIHLAGGHFDDKLQLYIDSHAHPIPDQVWDLYRFALEQAGSRTDAVFVERDQNFPDESGWRTEIRRVRRVAERAIRQPTANHNG
jgi:uncharacterized protein